MKAFITINYQRVVDIDEDEWNEAKQDYAGDFNKFAMVVIQKELGFYDEEAITINHMEL